MIKRIDHIAIAVHNIEEASRFYQDILGLTLEGVEEVEGMEARVAFLPVGETRIELVQPTNEQSGLGRFLATRGMGIHHICLEVDNIEAELGHLKEMGGRLIDEQPKKGAHGTKVGFIHPKTTGGVLIELCEHQGEDQG